MPIKLRALILCLLATLAGLPDQARANCDAIGVLSVVHDRYLTILTKDGDTRARAAARLYPYLAEVDTRQIARDLSKDVDAERVERVLNSARKLAEHVVSGVTMSLFGLVPHTQNVNWLGDVVTQSNCPKPAAPAQKKSSDGAASGAPASQHPTLWSKVESLARDTPQHLGIMVLFLAVLICTLGLFMARSRRFRIKRVKRLPRISVEFPVPVTYTDDLGRTQNMSVKAIDISLGGMKLGWPKPPAPETSVSLTLPMGEVLGSIIWSNAHYAGILFDAYITESDLADIRRL